MTVPTSVRPPLTVSRFLPLPLGCPRVTRLALPGGPRRYVARSRPGPAARI